MHAAGAALAPRARPHAAAAAAAVAILRGASCTPCCASRWVYMLPACCIFCARGSGALPRPPPPSRAARRAPTARTGSSAGRGMAPACTSWCIPKSRHFLQYSQRARAPVKCPPSAPAETPSLPPRRPPRHPRSPPPPRRPAAHRRRRAAHHPDCSQAGGATLHQLRFVSRIVMGLYISRLGMPSSTELTVHDYAPIWAHNAHKFQRRRQTRLVFASLVSLALLLALLSLACGKSLPPADRELVDSVRSMLGCGWH